MTRRLYQGVEGQGVEGHDQLGAHGLDFETAGYSSSPDP